MLRAATILILVGLSAASARANDVVAPDWSLETAEGNVIRLSEAVDERPVILFFWASWCPFCKLLMPHLQSIAIEYDGSVDILALSILDDGEPAEFIRQRGYDFTVLPDADPVAEQYGIFATPGIVIVDGQQVIRFDLNDLPRPDVPSETAEAGTAAIAAYVAPYWAAEIQRRLDEVLGTD